MAEVKVLHDQAGNTLTVWFGDPQSEYVCEETDDEVVLMRVFGRARGLKRATAGRSARSVSCRARLRV